MRRTSRNSQTGENMNWRNDGKAKETPWMEQLQTNDVSRLLHATKYSEVDLYLKNQKLRKLIRMSLEELYKKRKERDSLKKGFIDLKASVQDILKCANDADRTIKNVETKELLASFPELEACTSAACDEYDIQNLLTEFGMEEFEDGLESEPGPGDSALQVVTSGRKEDHQEDDEFAEFDFLPMNEPVFEQLPVQLIGKEDAELWKFEFLK